MLIQGTDIATEDDDDARLENSRCRKKRNWLIGIVVIVLGFCTALPYYRERQQAPTGPNESAGWQTPQIPLRVQPGQLADADSVLAPLREQSLQEQQEAWTAANQRAVSQLQPQARFTTPPALQPNFPAGVLDPAPRQSTAIRQPTESRWGTVAGGELNPMQPVDRAAFNASGAAIHASRPAYVDPDFDRHIVRDGESLPSIAARRMGDPQRADEIFQANRDLLESPDLLPVGITLRIPR